MEFLQEDARVINFWQRFTFFSKGEFRLRMIAQRSCLHCVYSTFVSSNDNLLLLGHLSKNYVKTNLCRAIGDRVGSLALYTITSDVETSIR